MFQNLCLIIDPTAFEADTPFIENPVLTQLEPLIQNNQDYDFGGHMSCNYCQSAGDINSTELKQKSPNAYSSCASTLSLNKIPSLKLDDLFAGDYANLKILTIKNRIESGGHNFFNKFKYLTKLQLTNCRGLASSIFKLKLLKYLEISNNPNDLFAYNFKSLSSLVHLKLDNPMFASNNKQILPLPGSLQVLELLNLNLNYLPFNIDNCVLVSFKCSGVKLCISANKNELTNLSQIKEIYSNYFSNSDEQLPELFNQIHQSKTEYLNHRELMKLNAFLFKRFARLGDTISGPSKYEGLTMSGIPPTVFDRTLLKELDLSGQAIKCLPDEIGLLVNLTRLNLDDCILLASLSARLAELPIAVLNIKNCLSLITPPAEIQVRGVNAIMNYLRRLSTGQVSCKRTKLMLVIENKFLSDQMMRGINLF